MYDLSEDKKMVRNERLWPGETLCLKKLPKPGEKVGVMGYSEYGVITNSREPVRRNGAG